MPFVIGAESIVPASRDPGDEEAGGDVLDRDALQGTARSRISGEARLARIISASEGKYSRTIT